MSCAVRRQSWSRYKTGNSLLSRGDFLPHFAVRIAIRRALPTENDLNSTVGAGAILF